MRTTMALGIATLVLAASLAPAGAATITVDAAGGADYDNIQAGVDAASEGDTVLVYPGTYSGAGDRDIEIGEKNIVLTSRDGAEATILANTSLTQEHRLFYFFDTGQDTTCLIRGFTLRGGRLFGLTGSDGAAINVGGLHNPPSPKFVDLVITDNYGHRGAGAYVNSPGGGCSPVFRNCEFRANVAQFAGGGVYCGNDATPLIADCSFVDNVASTQSGGGLYCSLNSHARVERCWFEGNAAGETGGGFAAWRSSPTIRKTVIVRNDATGAGGTGFGGAVSCRGFAAPVFTNCTLVSNSASDDGGAIYVSENATPRFENTIVAFTLPFGGLARGSAIACDGTGHPTFDTCCVHGNSGGDDLCGTQMNIVLADPGFCDLANDDVTLMSTSPCLPQWNPHAALIGARSEGCSNPAAEMTSWGSIKFMHR